MPNKTAKSARVAASRLKEAAGRSPGVAGSAAQVRQKQSLQDSQRPRGGDVSTTFAPTQGLDDIGVREKESQAIHDILVVRYQQLGSRTKNALNALIEPIGFDDYVEFLGVIQKYLYHIHRVAPYYPVQGLQEGLAQTIVDYLTEKHQGMAVAAVKKLSPKAAQDLVMATWAVQDIDVDLDALIHENAGKR